MKQRKIFYKKSATVGFPLRPSNGVHGLFDCPGLAAVLKFVSRHGIEDGLVGPKAFRFATDLEVIVPALIRSAVVSVFVVCACSLACSLTWFGVSDGQSAMTWLAMKCGSGQATGRVSIGTPPVR